MTGEIKNSGTRDAETVRDVNEAIGDRPFVTVVMPCLNEEKYIEECMQSLLAQDYPTTHLEVLVADGRSSDRTRAIVERISSEHPFIRLVDNPDRIQAAGLNRAILVARGDIVIRMDVHADYAPNFISSCVEVLAETGADNCGGAARIKTRNWFQKALDAALDSPLGVGGSKYRNPDNEGFVDTVFPGAFRRSIFEKVGLFDWKAITNEDAEINQRINDSGGKVFLSKKVVVYYYPRDSYKGLAKQYFKYGQGRARTFLKHKKLMNVRPMIPFFFTVGGAGLLLTSAIQPLTPFAFGAYGLGTFAEALRVGRRAGVALIPVVWSIFPVLHVSHGTGFAVGLVRYGLNPDWEEPTKLAPRAELAPAIHGPSSTEIG